MTTGDDKYNDRFNSMRALERPERRGTPRSEAKSFSKCVLIQSTFGHWTDMFSRISRVLFQVVRMHGRHT